MIRGTMNIILREMTIEDYDNVYALWLSIQGFGIRSVDDSRTGIEKFLKRNPSTSVVAVQSGTVVGSILCGHDGRRGCFYHVCVAKGYRGYGIGQKMTHFALAALREEGISKVNLVAFQENEIGNQFWQSMGWTVRADFNYYECIINEDNMTEFVK